MSDRSMSDKKAHRIAEALESIADSLARIAHPLLTVEAGQPLSGEFYDTFAVTVREMQERAARR